MNLSRDYIIKGFCSLLKEKQYEKISVCDICQKAGVSRMSFYRNFKSKEDLVYQGIDMITKLINKNIGNLELKNQYTITRTVFETILSLKPLIMSFEGNEIFKQLLDVGIKKIEHDIPIDFVNKTSKYIPVFYYGALTLVISKWLQSGANESPDEMARLICSLINDNIIQNN